MSENDGGPLFGIDGNTYWQGGTAVSRAWTRQDYLDAIDRYMANNVGGRPDIWLIPKAQYDDWRARGWLDENGRPTFSDPAPSKEPR